MIRHYGIPVKDIDRAIKFYEMLHFQPVSYDNAMINNKPVAICKLENGEGDCIELVQGETAVPHISLTINPLRFEILKSNHDAKMFEKEGICYLFDEDKNVIEIVEERGF